MNIELMKQWLEALEFEFYDDKAQRKLKDAITSLRQAIEQAEKQEPVAEFIGTLAVGSRSYHIVERKGPMTKGMKLYAREEKS